MIAWRVVTNAVLSALVAPPCAVCQRVLERPLDGAVCERCWHAVVSPAPPLHGSGLVTSASAVGEYDGVLREIIHALKYQGRRSAARGLSRLMAAHGQHVLSGADAVVPVPLHPRRERERGFNQADDLARGLGLPVLPALLRTRMTLPQVDLPAADRHRNVRDAFGLQKPSSLCAGKILVLVDDVTTTGATLEACARVLKEAGALEVRAITAARVASGPR